MDISHLPIRVKRPKVGQVAEWRSPGGGLNSSLDIYLVRSVQSRRPAGPWRSLLAAERESGFGAVPVDFLTLADTR